MSLPQIINAGVYTHAEKYSQKVCHFWIALNISGCVRLDTYYPDGTLCRSFDSRQKESCQTLSLAAPGFRSVFEYNSGRENWVIMFSFPSVTFSEKDNTFYWNYKDHKLPLPDTIRLKGQEVAQLRHICSTLCQLYHSSLPGNCLEAELLALQLLHFFLRTPVPADDRVELFRKRLSEDVLWEKSISRHCMEMGVNRDLLRKEFFLRYKISPGEYRIELRMRKILHLIAYSDLTLKEIAFDSGMKNLSHLSAFVRLRCGKTPTQLVAEYRKSH